EGITRPALLPGGDGFRRAAPSEAVELGTEALGGDAREMKQDVVKEIPPGELPDESLQLPAQRGGPRRSRVPSGREDRARREGAEMEVGRKRGGALSRWEVPVERVAARRAGEKPVEQGSRGA